MSQESIIVESAPQQTAPNPDAAAAKPPAPKPDQIKLPDDDSIDPTYRGKTAAELIEMHKNATSRIGAQGQELGVWRGLVADLSTAATRQGATTATQETALKLTSDELLTNPVEAISKVVERSLEKHLKPLREDRVNDQRESELAALNRDFPTMKQIGNDPDFQNWANSAPGRAADARAVVQGDPRAARRLLEAWADRESFKAATKAPAESGKPQGTQGARAATTEAGGSGGAQTTGKIFNRAEIVQLIIDKPEVYQSDAYQAELLTAAKEGRIR